MKKVRFLTLFAIVFLLNSFNSYCQHFKKNTAYAGISLTQGFNALNRTDRVLYFRTNGTFCKNLEAKDWQTRVDGSYEIKKDKIILSFIDASEPNNIMSLRSGKKYGDYGGAKMIRLTIPNKILIGRYGHSSASSSGGSNSGVTFIATSRTDDLYFLENNKFTRNIAGQSFVSGNNIGGGTESENSSNGKYTINKGLLTLTYNDGKVEKKSFFYDEDLGQGENDNLVVIGGDIFFYEKIDFEKIKNTKSPLVNKSSEDHNQDIANNSSKNVATALSLLAKTKKKHGGVNIDKLNTLKVEIYTSGINFSALFNPVKKQFRIESKNPNFNYIEQLENNSGWIFQNGKLTEMPSDRVQEIQRNLISGIFGLQTKNLNKAKVISSKSSGENLLVILEVDGHNIGYVIDSNSGKMIASMAVTNDTKEITYYSDYKSQNGLLFPFKEITENGGKKIEIKYNSIVVNPTLTTKDWAKPN